MSRGDTSKEKDKDHKVFLLVPGPFLVGEEKQKILKDLKKIATTSPYHWVDSYIGEWYEEGWGGEEKKKQAEVWWTKAINGGSTDAMCNLAVAYETGNLY